MTAVEFIIELKDKAVSGVEKIALEFSKAKTNADKLTGSISTLQSKGEKLRIARDAATSESDLKRLNRELIKTETQITKMQKMGTGGKIKDAVSQIPGASLLTNPLVAGGAAIAGIEKFTLGFDEGMAKINTTAQLPKKELENLKQKLIDLGTDVGADLSGIPEAYEKILSQTNDVALSTDILKASLKGSKAGFADQTVVADAVSRSLSLVGKENTNAQEVLDTLFAAKRVGAGEFKDFATYIPGLIAGGQALGVGFKETAGVFAYMTGKGMSAEKSAMLIENAFTALGKSDIQKGMEDAGISVFNEDGSMKKLDVIFKQFEAKTKGMSDQGKSNFLEKIGLKDAQAKQAFMVLSADSQKLASSLKDVANSAGEADKALKFSENTTQNLKAIWSQFQGIILNVGGILSTILYPVFILLGVIVGSLADSLSWIITGFNGGSTAAQIMAVALTGVSLALSIGYLWMKRTVIWTAIKSGWDIVAATTTGIFTAAVWKNNAAWYANPIAWIIAGIAAFIAIIVICYQKVDWFRGIIYGTWAAIKGFGNIIKDYVIDRIKGILSGVSGLGKALLQLFNGDYKKAWETAKQAGADLIGLDAAKNAADKAKALGKTVAGEYNKGVKEVNDAKEDEKEKGKSGVADNKTKNKNKDKDTTNTLDKVASGGTRNTQISINLNKEMVGSINFTGGLKENASDMRKQIEEQLVKILYAAQSAS